MIVTRPELMVEPLRRRAEAHADPRVAAALAGLAEDMTALAAADPASFDPAPAEPGTPPDAVPAGGAA